MIINNTYLKKNLKLAWPLAINALLVQSMLMIDTLLVAPLGEVSVAAMGVAFILVATALGILMAIGNAVQLIVGRAHGSKSQADLSIAFWVGLFVNAITAIIFYITVLFYGADLVMMLTDDPELVELSVAYLDIIKFIILITGYTQICTAFYNGNGNTKIPLMGYLIEIPFNAVLSYILINGSGEFEGLGVEGAAWGSLVAVSLRTVFFFVVMKFDNSVDLKYPRERPFLTQVRLQLKEILPIASNFIILFIGASIYQLLYARLDLHSFVAITLIFPWFRIGTQFITAWAHASAINISQSLGQNDIQNLEVFISICKRATIGLTLFIAMLFFLLSQGILFVYPKIEPETQVALAAIAPIYILMPIIRGYNSVSGNILRALGDSSGALKINFVSQWMISLPILALLVLYFKVSVFWAFGMMLFEELLKPFFFYRFTSLRLKNIKIVL